MDFENIDSAVCRHTRTQVCVSHTAMSPPPAHKAGLDLDYLYSSSHFRNLHSHSIIRTNATGGAHHSPVSFFLLSRVESRGAEAGTAAVVASPPPNANEANGLSLTLMFKDPAAPSSPDDSCCSAASTSLPSIFQVLDMPCTMATHTWIIRASLLPSALPYEKQMCRGQMKRRVGAPNTQSTYPQLENNHGCPMIAAS